MKSLTALHNILIIDAATTQAVVGVIRDGQCLAQHQWTSSRGSPGILVSQIQALLHDTATAWHALDAILVGCGPGQYAGLRVSVTVAQALQRPAHAQVVGICSAYALCAAATAETADILVCGDARRNHIWLYHWKHETRQASPALQVISRTDVASINAPEGSILISPDYARLHEQLPIPETVQWMEGDRHPTAEAIYKAACSYPDAITSPEILYVHPPVTTAHSLAAQA